MFNIGNSERRGSRLNAETKRLNGTSVSSDSAASRSIWKQLGRQKYPQLFVWIGIAYLCVFHFLPLFGILMAFKDYSVTDGIRGIFTAPWVGFRYFEEFYHDYQFGSIVRNTLALSLLKLIFTFPMPILFALMLNEVKVRWFKRTVQTVSYLPHFISWVVVYGLVVVFMSGESGMINHILMSVGIIKEPIGFLTSPNNFWGLAVGSAIWKEMGWWTIIFLAALSGIDPAQYEAAQIDGAGRLSRIWHVTLPGIKGTIVVVLILALGSLLGGGLVGSNFEQAFLLGNPLNADKSEILQTYAFRMGLAQGRYSFATAIDLMQSVISIALILGSNFAAKKTTKTGLF
ncbi:sugar ABC transporter permease [Cohnella sp. CBP 2801]|uniref:Sugar ABC transporter permease n=1 Tax=Cohnella zeiphila TaxID=2761120 RepID=A0A7X0SJC3_9BACL|nr:sugar ABC transporter permease [Cohnella zeiphila]